MFQITNPLVHVTPQNLKKFYYISSRECIVDPWVQDLEFLVDNITQIHPNPHHENSKERWDEVVDDVKQKMEKLHGSVKITQLYRIVALLADSHSRINLKFGSDHARMESHLPEQYDIRYPFRCIVFEDGVFITQATNKGLLGKKIVGINGYHIKLIAELLYEYAPVENKMGFAAYFPFFVTIPLFLAAIGIIENPGDQISLEFDDKGSATMIPIDADLTNVLDTLPYPAKLYLRPKQSLSMRTENENLIVDIRSIQDSDEISMMQMAHQLDNKLTELEALPNHGGITRLIIDLRGNGGGNNILAQPLVRTIIQHPWIDYPGRIFVCIDRWTFSAAINLSNYLEQYTWALFAGESFAGRVNHYGDSKTVVLPYTGLEVKISTLYWQDSDPRDERSSIIPDIPVSLTYDQYISQDDIVIMEISKFKVDDVWHEYYQKYPPRLKIRRDSQSEEIKTYFTR